MNLKYLLIFLMFSSFLFAQKVIDKVVAVVDKEIILQSELEFQVNQYAFQRKIEPNTPGLREQILNSLIEEKLALAQADIDSIMVTEEEINGRLDYQVQYLIQQYGSREKVEQLYGMSLEKIKKELRDDVEKNIMVQKLQEKNFGTIDVSRREVEDFLTVYRDSIGIIPEKVNISHIYRNPKTTETVKQKFKDLASSILDSIKAGSDFSEMAKKYSEDPGSAQQGGDLGFVKRGVFYPEFESAAFALEPNQMSDVVESPVGYHIIQLIEKRGESIHARHILIKIKNDEQADINTIQFLSDLRDSVLKGSKLFSDLAKKYSEDKETAVFGGELGIFYLNQLDKNLLDIVSKLKEGEISYPRRIEYGAGSYGYHIVFLENRTPQHVPDLKSDYNEIKKLAEDYKRQKLYTEWIQSLKDQIFWEVRI